jgi:hypothetical protein
MKKISNVIVFPLACVLSFCSCKKAGEQATQTKTIEKNTCIAITGNTLPVICFDSLINDSRCPADVVCGSAGYAVVKLGIKNKAGTTQQFSLSIGMGQNAIPPNDTIINGYHIKLADVLPYPLVSAPNAGPKKVVLEISN